MIMTAFFFPTYLSIGAILFTIFVSRWYWYSFGRVPGMEGSAARSD